MYTLKASAEIKRSYALVNRSYESSHTKRLFRTYLYLLKTFWDDRMLNIPNCTNKNNNNATAHTKFPYRRDDFGMQS